MNTAYKSKKCRKITKYRIIKRNISNCKKGAVPYLLGQPPGNSVNVLDVF
jgi:hypothetical protein